MQEHCSGQPTVLNIAQMNELATHIRNLAAVGFPCDRADVRNLAYEYAMKNGVEGFSEKKTERRILLVSRIYRQT
jgi:hypothetical protein